MAKRAGQSGSSMKHRRSGYRGVSLLGRLYLLVALAVLPAIAIQAYNELALRRDRDAQMRAEAQRLAEFAASELDGLLDGAKPMLLALARTPSIRDGDAAACGQLLSELGRDLTEYSGLGAIDLAGRQRCDQAEPLFGGEWRATAAARAQAGFHVGSFTPGETAGQSFLPITLPFRDRDGRIAGVVGSASISSASTGCSPPGRCRRVPRSALRIATVRCWSACRIRPASASRCARNIAGCSRRRGRIRWRAPARTGSTGSSATCRRRRSSTARSLVSVGLSTRAATAGVEAATRRGMLLIMLGVALAMIAARLAGRAFILQPIEALVRAVERWRAGDLGARVGLAGHRSEFATSAPPSTRWRRACRRTRPRSTARSTASAGERDAVPQFAENSRDMLWIWDRRTARLEYLSPAFSEIWGRSPKRCGSGGDELLATIHPDDRERVGRGAARRAGRPAGPHHLPGAASRWRTTLGARQPVPDPRPERRDHPRRGHLPAT